MSSSFFYQINQSHSLSLKSIPISIFTTKQKKLTYTHAHKPIVHHHFMCFVAVVLFQLGFFFARIFFFFVCEIRDVFKHWWWWRIVVVIKNDNDREKENTTQHKCTSYKRDRGEKMLRFFFHHHDHHTLLGHFFHIQWEKEIYD